MNLELLAFGGIIFWIIVGLASILIMTAIEKNESNSKPGLAVGILVIITLIFLIFGDLWGYVTADWKRVVGFILGYFAVGALWSLPKCYCMLRGVREQLQEMRDNFKDEKGIPIGSPIPEEHLVPWENRVNNSHIYYEYGVEYDKDNKKIVAPRFRKYRGKLIMWACLWPWSFIWTFIRHPVLWGIELAVDWMQGLYQRMSDAMFSGFNDEE